MKQAKALVPGLERGLKILELLALQPSPGMTQREFQRELALPRVSLYRLLRVLQEHGYVAQDPNTGTFRLGSAALVLGYKARLAVPQSELLRPALRDIAFRTHQMAEAVCTTGYWRMITLDTWQSEQSPPHILARPGMQYSLQHLNAHGLCYLCFDGERRIGEYLKKVASAPERDAPVSAGLPEQFKVWKQIGYAWEKSSGRNVGRLAVPVYKLQSKPRRLLLTLGIISEIKHLTPSAIALWAVLLKTHARRLELSGSR